MSCYDQNEFEKVILESTAMPQEMYVHLLQCAACRELFLFLSGWNDLFAGQQRPSGTVPLQGMVLGPINEPYAGVRNPYRLAAQGEQPSDLYRVQSFSSLEHGIVGRLMQEKSTLQTSLYLLADRIQNVQALRVELEGSDLAGVTDLQGCIDFGVQPPVTCSGIRILSPQAVFELTEMATTVPMVTETHTYILKNELFDQLLIEVNDADKHVVYRLHFQRHQGKSLQNVLEIVAVTDRRTIREELRQGVTVIETEKPERLLRVQIY